MLPSEQENNVWLLNKCDPTNPNHPHGGTKTDRQTDRPTNRQADRQAGRQTGRQTRHTTDELTYRQTD